ncbi:MAG: hypothetical protein SFV19_05925 [Rhodospirillaceae bacterium]|nr:hypothetical protein [Rhodospirillaceae bacterium]
MARLVTVVSVVVAALASPAWAQNEGPCAFDFECGDAGKCVKANPSDTIGKCALAEGVKPEDIDEDDEAPSPSVPDRQSAGQEPAPVKGKECLIHLECGFGNLCYKKPLSLKGTCGPGKPSVLGELLGGDESLGRGQNRSDDRAKSCSFDQECGYGNRCYKERGAVRGQCGAEFKSDDGRIWDGRGRDGTLATEADTCFSDLECDRGNRCYKQQFEPEGVCGPARRSADDDDERWNSWEERNRNGNPDTWEGRQQRERLRTMEDKIGEICISNFECGDGLRCQTVRGRRQCVPE